jgi:hypothetical protein
VHAVSGEVFAESAIDALSLHARQVGGTDLIERHLSGSRQHGKTTDKGCPGDQGGKGLTKHAKRANNSVLGTAIDAVCKQSAGLLLAVHAVARPQQLQTIASAALAAIQKAMQEPPGNDRRQLG